MPFRLRLEFRYVFAFCLACFAGNISVAQNEFLATLNYSNLNVNRIGNIPGVTWVNGNTAYDQNHKHFFFQGSPNNGPPWTLYTIDAVTGTVIYSVLCSANGNQGQGNGLEYDNVNNILYAIYFFNGLAQFAKIDPATGLVTIISNIPPYMGFTESAYDTKDHLYIVSNGNSLLGIDANTGLIKNNLTGLTISQIKYDNATGKLYGIKISPILPNPQFDSVSLSTGTLHPIADLPKFALPQIGTFTIDESAGKYIFVGTNADAACITNDLYVLDINSGAVLSRNPYPYAKATGSIGYENVIEYSMDNARGILYALNWHPPPTGDPKITITASANPACIGIPVTFTATSDVQLSNPNYQWLINGFVTGNGNSYTNDHLVDGDIVQAVLLQDCSPSGDSSNKITMTVKSFTPVVSIDVTPSNFCTSDAIIFTASINGDVGKITFQWQVNNENVGTNSNTLSQTGFKTGDAAHCIVNLLETCGSSIVSNDIVLDMKQTPTVFIGNDTVVTPGSIVALNPFISGSIVSYQWTPSTYLSDPSIINPVFTAGSSTDYRLLVTADNGCTAAAKISIIVYRELRMPNAFTPNGDGRNDIFRIPASSRTKIKSFSIYNRWGQIIFKTSDSGTGWDGSFHNQSQPTGSYVWMIEYENPFTKKAEMKKGVVMLVR